MPSLPSRKSLETLKRVDLQKLCKDYGVKANLKSEALIDLLLDTQKPAPRFPRRAVSTRISGRSSSSRISSVIIHDTGDKNEDEDEGLIEEHPRGHEANTQTTPPATRARKAKEQTRLGVGRPVAAGGSGPRAVTRSLSIPKGKRAKASKTMKPTGDTIPEEEPELQASHEFMQDIENPPPKDALNNGPHAHLKPPHAHTNTGEESLASLATIDKHVADALRPLYEQMKSLKSELELMQSLKAELGQLKNQVAEMGTLRTKVEALTGELQELRMQTTSTTAVASEHRQSSKAAAFPFPSSPLIRKEPSSETAYFSESDSVGLQTSLRVTANDIATPNHPPIMLGKRQRDSLGSNMAGITEEGSVDEPLEDDPGNTVVKPARKRAKMTNKQDDQRKSTVPVSGHFQGEEEELPASDIPRFTVFRGPGEHSDPLPPNHLFPDLFPPSPAAAEPSFVRQGLKGTSSAHASENQQPFSFSFVPMSSTPAHGLFTPSFPYPEPPQSPSPAGINPPSFLNPLRGERTDVFQPFGFPNPSRPSRSRLGGNMGGGFVDPAALTRGISDRDPVEISRNNAGNDTSMGSPEPGPSSGATEAVADVPLMKRTMYGTELDGDTRFGDFGVEGVGSNGAFWAGGRY